MVTIQGLISLTIPKSLMSQLPKGLSLVEVKGAPRDSVLHSPNMNFFFSTSSLNEFDLATYSRRI
jgi:hypothetical protein